MQNADRRKASRQAQQIDDGLYYAEEPQYPLPRNGLTHAIIIGIAGGIVALIVSIAIVFSHASLFNDAASAASKNGAGLSYQAAISIIIWQGLGAIVDLIIAFAIGMIAGKTVVKRRLGFVAGMVVGAVVYIGIFLAQYIPGYPGVITGNTHIQPLGIVAAIFQCLIYAVIGGLLSLWGATIMTRKHPYYLLRRQQARLKE